VNREQQCCRNFRSRIVQSLSVRHTDAFLRRCWSNQEKG